MNRKLLMLMLLLVLVTRVAAAQVVVTEEPAPPVPQEAVPGLIPTTAPPPEPAAPVDLPTDVPADLPPVAEESAPAAPQPAFDNAVLPVLVNARNDLEILANQLTGSERPAGWSGSLDVNNPQLAVLIRLDLELLMAQSVGLDNIPPGWFGAVPSTAYAIARDIRHDLELLADVMLGQNIRPPGWAGDNALMRCDRSTQNLVQLLQRSTTFAPTVLPTDPNYCQVVMVQAAQFTESNLLAGDAPVLADAASADAGGAGGPVNFGGAGTANALPDIALAFLDRHATRRVGAIPTTESFEPVARSLTQFSRMALVRGSGFEVFVDYETTTMTQDQFLRLPDVNGFPANPHCEAEWCNSPRQIAGMGSASRSTTASSGPGGRQLVGAGTHMIIHYDGDDQNGMTKVRMELCDRPTSTGQAICEPATEVILPDGSAAAVAGTVNGIPQFYVPYTYTATSVRSSRFYTADLWIDPPDTR